MEIKRLVVSDMDGTLLDKQQRISTETQQAVLRFLDQGGKFAVATGRSMSGTARFVAPLGIQYGILLNGALLYDFVNARAIETHPLPEAESRAIVETILERYPNISVQVYGEQVICLLQGNDIVSAKGTREEFSDLVTPTEFLPKEWLKITLSGSVPDILDLQEHAASTYPNLKLLRSSTHFCEINGLGVTKGVGLATIANMYGLTLADTVAVGDNENDLPMLQTAGLALAVDNACDSVRKAAHHILPDHNEHPLKHAVELICN